MILTVCGTTSGRLRRPLIWGIELLRVVRILLFTRARSWPAVRVVLRPARGFARGMAHNSGELTLRSLCRNLSRLERAHSHRSPRHALRLRANPRAGPLAFRSVFAPFSPLCHASRRRAYPFGHPLVHALYRLPAMRPARMLRGGEAL